MSDEEESDGEGEGGDSGGVAEAVSGVGDARSIRSFESMLNASKERGRNKVVRPRKSISDRLASVSAFVTSKVGVFFVNEEIHENLTFFFGDRHHLLAHQGLLRLYF